MNICFMISHKIVKATAHQEISRVFRMLDRKNNGVLDLEEFKEAIQTFLPSVDGTN